MTVTTFGAVVATNLLVLQINEKNSMSKDEKNRVIK
jgi:hypothetical protein